MPDSSGELWERHWAGPVLVRGLSGSGKTRLALKRCEFLARALPPTQRVLFLVGTASAAMHAARCLPAQLREQIELSPLRSWVAARCRRLGLRFEALSIADRKRIWTMVMQTASADFSESLYLREWLRVQAWGVTTLPEYLELSCSDPESLDETQRLRVWEALATFQAALDAEGLAGPSGFARMLTDILRENASARLHASVVVDNCEDASPAELRLLRALVVPREDDLFLLGESAQRLEPVESSCRDCGIFLEQRHFELERGYRFGNELHQWAAKTLTPLELDDLDGHPRPPLRLDCVGEAAPPTVRAFDSFDEELGFVSETLDRWLEHTPAEQIAVTTRHPRALRSLSQQLQRDGHAARLLDSSSEPDRPSVCLGSFAQLKGLEFERVLLIDAAAQTQPGVNDAPLVPCRARADAIERSLFYVASTRARSELLLSYHGTPSNGPFDGLV